MKGWKCRSRELLKAIFLSPKNNKRADRLCIKFSSTFNTSVLRCLYPLFQNQHPHFLLPHLFRRISQPPGQVLLITTIVLDLSRIFLEFFLKPVYPTMVAKKFQIHGVKITGKYICESKKKTFLLLPPSRTLPLVFIITIPGRRKLPTPPKQSFLKIYFSPAKRGTTMELKILPN